MAEAAVISAKKVHKRKHKMKYAKWGVIFILPFFIAYAVFQLYPLISTFRYSLFNSYQDTTTLKDVTSFVGFDNYVEVFKDGELLRYFGNTAIIWAMGFIPQIIMSLMFASWFTDIRLRLKGTGFFKIVFYLPNILMAASMAGLFVKLFSVHGPVNEILANLTGYEGYYDSVKNTVFNFFTSMWGTRGVIALVNYLMWTGNTTILLVAGIMGVDTALYEAASIDGANAKQLFRKITIPMLKPIMLYVLVTSLIGGLQMFDVPQLLTGSYGPAGGVGKHSMTIVMYLNETIRDYGTSGTISVVMFVVAAILSVAVFKLLSEKKEKKLKTEEVV